MTHTPGGVWRGFPAVSQTIQVGGAEAQLGELSLEAGGRSVGLQPVFAGSIYDYTASVASDVTAARLSVAPAFPRALVSVNGDTAQRGARVVTIPLAEGSNRVTIVVTPATGNLEPNTYRLNIRRQRAPRLKFEPTSLSVNEGGSATYTVDLDTRWLGSEVTVTIASDNPAVSVSPDTVSYRPGDWSPRTVTVTAAQDDDAEDDVATLTHRASGGHLDGVTGRLRVTVKDTTVPEPTPTPTPSPTPEVTPTPSPTPEPVEPPPAVGELSVTTGDEPGTLILRWETSDLAQRHWVAGIKQSDWDANEFGNVIWEAAQSSTMHTLEGLESGAEYVFSITAGRGEGAATRWSPWAPLARGTPE